LTKNGQPLQQHCNGIQAKPSSPQPDQEIQRPKHCRKMVFQVLQLEPAKRPIKKPEKQQSVPKQLHQYEEGCRPQEPHHQRLPQPVALAITNYPSQVRPASAKTPEQTMGPADVPRPKH
jgi:hypothetical protein